MYLLINQKSHNKLLVLWCCHVRKITCIIEQWTKAHWALIWLKKCSNKQKIYTFWVKIFCCLYASNNHTDKYIHQKAFSFSPRFSLSSLINTSQFFHRSSLTNHSLKCVLVMYMIILISNTKVNLIKIFKIVLLFGFWITVFIPSHLFRHVALHV